MQIKITTDAKRMGSVMKSASGKQVRFALKNTLNDVAFDVTREHKNYVREVFDKPTPWTEKALEVYKARANRMAASVAMKTQAFKGNPPTKFLAAQAMGGKRKLKRYEQALYRKGILPEGMVTLPTRKYRNRYGNISGPLTVQILSFLRAFGEMGFNMNRARTKAEMKAAARTRRAQRENPTKFFVKYKAGTFAYEKGQAIGIFKSLPGGKDEPVLMFIAAPTYKKRYDLVEHSLYTIQKLWLRSWLKNYRFALETMRHVK